MNTNALNEFSWCYLSHKLRHFGIITLAFWLLYLGYQPNFLILKIHPNNKPNILVKKKLPKVSPSENKPKKAGITENKPWGLIIRSLQYVKIVYILL